MSKTEDELVIELVALLDQGLTQGTVMEVLASRYSQEAMVDIVQAARDIYEYPSSNDLEIDDSPIFATAGDEKGTWVSAWVWIAAPEEDHDGSDE